MTGEQKQRIYQMRKQGLPFSDIAARVGLTKTSVKTFCWRNNLSDTDMERGLSRGGFCPQCGQRIFQPHRSRPKKYCSDQCRYAWWRNHENEINRKSMRDMTCNHCGTVFSCYPSQQRRFCCHECYIAFRYESESAATTHEKAAN